MTSEKEYTYSYTDGTNVVLMDPESFEQTIIPLDLLGDAAPFLQDNMTVTVDMVEDEPTGIRLPSTVVLEVVEADPVVKGQTATSSYKPAKPQPTASRPRCRPSSRPASASSSAPRTRPRGACEELGPAP